MGGNAIPPLTRRLAGALLLLLALGLGLLPPAVGTAAGAAGRHHKAAVKEGSGASIQDAAERSEVQKTLRRIASGGPFLHHQDGTVFANREGRLPAKARGYYHEYTVETPGSPDRGARRIIRGTGGELYYTHDHYRTFLRIDPEAFR